MIHGALPAAQRHFRRFSRHRLIRKNAYPYLPAPLDRMGHGAARGFDLPRRNPARLKRFQAVGTERKLGAASFSAAGPAALPFTMLYFFGLQHSRGADIVCRSCRTMGLPKLQYRRRPVAVTSDNIGSGYFYGDVFAPAGAKTSPL